MGSGVIFLVIIGLWCAFLVPHVIRRRAELGGSRVRDRFSTAMRVLARRSPAPVRRAASRSYLHRPRVPCSSSSSSPGAVAVSPPRRPLPVAGLAVLGLLALAGLAVPAAAAAAWFGVVPGAAVLAPLGGLAAVVVLLRARAVRRRRPRSHPAAAAVHADPAPAAPVPPAPPEPVTEIVLPDAGRGAATDSTWTPVPVPPPTYTLKPPAPRRAPPPAAPVLEEQAALVLEEQGPREPAVWDLDEVLERRRAAAG